MTTKPSRTAVPIELRALPGLALLIWFGLTLSSSTTPGHAHLTVPRVGRSELPASNLADPGSATRAVVNRVVDPTAPPSPAPTPAAPSDESPAAPTTTAPAPPPAPVEPVVTTTAPAPTTTTVPPTAPQEPPPPEPPPPEPQPPESAPPPDTAVDDGVGAHDPGTDDLLARVQAAFDSSVTDPWRTGLPVRFEIQSGYTSMAYTDGTIRMSSYHAGGDWERLRAIVSHEFGHVIAFRYGSGRYFGAPPEGWPESGGMPAERWGDCVAGSFTGYPLGAHHSDPCAGDSLDWTVAYLAAGPPS